jgi:thiosulfate/3-mercaptopyruvate sulfurtransferase
LTDVPHTTLISTSDLAGHLRGYAVVDCRYDLQNEQWGRDQYLAAHVPGAVYASLGHDLAGTKTGRNGRHPLPALDSLAATFGRLGINSQTQVVAYDQDTGMYASRLWWLLRYAGHEAVAVLDGGWMAWTSEGRPTRSGEETRDPVVFTPAPGLEHPVSVDEIAALLGDRDHVLIDARAPERFEGRVEPIDRVPGHIPGAVNRHYKDNVTAQGTFESPDALREQFTRVLAGHDPRQAIVYCGSGVTACHNRLAMEHAGLRGSRLYPGSWSEWSSDPARPIETTK